MAISIVMPALEMAQETGKLVFVIKPEGATVAKGELDSGNRNRQSGNGDRISGRRRAGWYQAKPGDVVPWSGDWLESWLRAKSLRQTKSKWYPGRTWRVSARCPRSSTTKPPR